MPAARDRFAAYLFASMMWTLTALGAIDGAATTTKEPKAAVTHGDESAEPGAPAGGNADSSSPKSGTEFFARGEIRAKKGDLDGAIRDFDAGLAIDPNNVKGRAFRAGVLHKKGDPDRAR